MALMRYRANVTYLCIQYTVRSLFTRVKPDEIAEYFRRNAQYQRFARLGCTRSGSPGIFGYSGG